MILMVFYLKSNIIKKYNMLNGIRKEIWLRESENMLWSANWEMEKKLQVSSILNNHWFLDNHDSEDILSFLCWEVFLQKILDFKKQLQNTLSHWLALDIDETLSWTSYFWYEKLIELFWVDDEDLWLSPIEMAKKYHLVQNVTRWMKNKDAIEWMYQARDNDEIQEHLPLIELTDIHYREIHDNIISFLSYITVRPDIVSTWTTKWLQKYNFPESEVIHIPSELEYLFWNLWKACVLDILYPNIDWIVDDNPKLIKMLPERYKWNIFLYSHENCDYNHINIHISQTILDVRKNIENIYIK